MLFTADFETTTYLDENNEVRVWAYGLCEIGNPENFIYGNSLDDFIEFCSENENHILYFHNLKFDGSYIISWLFNNGFKHVNNRKDTENKTFTTLISDKNQFYRIEIFFKKKGKKTNKVTIYDSLKIIPFGVDKVAKSFNLPISKLEIDYNTKREIGHILTKTEVNYLKNDVTIMAMALDILFKQGLDRMTQGSNALYDYKNIIGEKRFEKLFPTPEYDSDIRQSYKGGFAYVSPMFQEKDIEKGLVLDVNSLYPFVMYTKSLPFGEGKFFEGEYKKDKAYTLYIQMFTCQFELKKGYIPTIQLKHTLAFMPTQYLENNIGAEDEPLCLTSVDLELFFEHYNVYNIEYISGWKFKATTGVFKEYIDKWIAIKIQAKMEKNKGMYTLAKLMLNSLYGKFALNPKVRSKIPYLDKEGIVRYENGEEDYREPIYIPIGTFITAWARYTTITAAQKVYNRFMYADTDSLHLRSWELPEGINISDTELGYWKNEFKFKKARYIRQKSYMEYGFEPSENLHRIIYDEPIKFTKLKFNFKNRYKGKISKVNRLYWKITCAGMSEKCYKFVTFENFKKGAVYKGALKQKYVKGGIMLVPTDFTLKG